MNKIELKPDPKEADIVAAAAKLGLRPVGWIFTDLVADDLSKGTVKNFRGNIVRQYFSSFYFSYISTFEYDIHIVSRSGNDS